MLFMMMIGNLVFKNIKGKNINYLKGIEATLVEIPYTPGISSTSIIKRLHED